MKGKVYLVGAGPGDPGLITMKGLKCLKQAEVIIYDHLVDERLLQEARPDAELIYVGKSPQHHALEQPQINELLVTKAQQDKVVVRLKGGDPFVLGRGGEEAEALASNGIPFEIVPGVSAAVAVPAYAGIPVTHRSLSSSFAVFTGHEDPSKAESNLAWDKLATAADTLVFLMGVANLAQIATELIKNGRPPATPAALISQGTTPQQRTLVGSLENIAALAERENFQPPAVLVVGEVVKLRQHLAWFDNRPLFGHRILVTRSRHQASALSQLLAERGALPVEWPTIEIQPIKDNRELDQAISRLASYHWLIFTSANGVDAFFQHLTGKGKDVRALKGLEIGAIGPATAAALERWGLHPDFVPDKYTTENIVSGLKERGLAGQCILLARAEKVPPELVEGLARLGAEVHQVAVYRTVPAGVISPAKEMLRKGDIDVITFASSSTVHNLVALMGEDWPAQNKAKVACIGPVTAATAIQAGLKVDIMAKKHTIAGLVEAIERVFRV
jgi:uroporphyrinogen III methyltransferase/synthase